MLIRYKFNFLFTYYNRVYVIVQLQLCEWQNGFNPDNKGDLVRYTGRSKTNKGTSVGVYRWDSRKGHSFSLGLHSTVFQAEIYAIKACIMENIEKGYTGRNIYILSDSQAAIKALDSFQINSKLVWDCHQSLVKLAEHNNITGSNWCGYWDTWELMGMK
jgi:hypothetical protein